MVCMDSFMALTEMKEQRGGYYCSDSWTVKRWLQSVRSQAQKPDS